MILAGELTREKLEQKQQMASGGAFEERFAVVNLIQGTLRESAREYERVDCQLAALYEMLLHLKKQVKKASQDEKCGMQVADSISGDVSVFEKFAREQENSLQIKIKMELISGRERKIQETAIRRLEEYVLTVKKEHLRSVEKGFKRICKSFEEDVVHREELIQKLQKELRNAFSFIKESFGEEQEMLLLVTGITADNEMTSFIAENGCPAYFQYSEMLLCNKEERDLRKACLEAVREI